MKPDNCESCGKEISWREYKYSMDLFKKSLCINCQMDERKRVYPDKLASFINKSIKAYR